MYILPPSISKKIEGYRWQSFTSARGWEIPPLPWTNLSPPFSTGEPLPAFLRREPLLDTTAGIVAHAEHPLLDGRPAVGNLSRYPWIDFDAAAPAAPNRVGQTTLDCLLGQLFRQTGNRATTILRASAASLFLMASGTWLAPASFRKSQCIQYSSG